MPLLELGAMQRRLSTVQEGGVSNLTIWGEDILSMAHKGSSGISWREEEHARVPWYSGGQSYQNNARAVSVSDKSL